MQAAAKQDAQGSADPEREEAEAAGGREEGPTAEVRTCCIVHHTSSLQSAVWQVPA